MPNISNDDIKTTLAKRLAAIDDMYKPKPEYWIGRTCRIQAPAEHTCAEPAKPRMSFSESVAYFCALANDPATNCGSN